MRASRTYSDWLPSANIAIFPTQNLIIRAAAAEVITRPTLGSLTPGGSADGFNFRVTSGNQSASGDVAIYDFDRRIITLVGGVVLQRAEDMLMNAPSEPTNEQLRELRLRVVPKDQ